MQRRSSARLAEAVGLQQHQLDPGSMVGAAGGPQLQPAPLPGVGASLLNMPLQEQLRMMQQGGALPAAPPLVLSGAPPAGPPAGAPAPSPAPTGRKKAQRGTVARASEREATKGTTSSSNRPLSSRFRGVCWNRKNKRWQAAINSGGKYLYLGSYVDEDEAAMAFDRAAIKLRGKKGKLNFNYDDYVDADGNLKEDIVLPEGAKDGAPPKAKDGAAAKGRGKKAKGGAGDAAAAGAVAVAGAGDAGGGGGANGANIFNSGIANLSMEDVKRLLAAGGGGGGGGGGAPPGGPPVIPTADRGVTTGFVGSLPAVSAAPHAYGGAGGSAFAPHAAGLGPDLPLRLPDLAAPRAEAAAAMAAAAAGAPLGGGHAGGGGGGWGRVMDSFRPLIESELGEGRALQQLVEPPHAAAAGAGGGGSMIKGVVYTQPGGGGGGGGNNVTYGAALWDGARLLDAGAKPNLEAALETATSLAAGEEDTQGDAALRDLLGGPSGLVPRAASLALFQALGTLRGGEAPHLDLPDGDAAAADGGDGGPPAGKRTRSATAAAAAAAAAAAGAKRARRGGRGASDSGDEDGGAAAGAGAGGAAGAQGPGGGMSLGSAFANTSALANTNLSDMLRGLAGMAPPAAAATAGM